MTVRERLGYELKKERQEKRATDAKFGRWTKKIARDKIIYSVVAASATDATGGHEQALLDSR